MTKRRSPDDWFSGLAGTFRNHGRVSSYSTNTAQGGYGYPSAHSSHENYVSVAETRSAGMLPTIVPPAAQATPVRKEPSIIYLDDTPPTSPVQSMSLSSSSKSLQKDPSVIILDSPPPGAKRSTPRVIQKESTIEVIDGPIILPPSKRQRTIAQPPANRPTSPVPPVSIQVSRPPVPAVESCIATPAPSQAVQQTLVPAKPRSKPRPKPVPANATSAAPSLVQSSSRIAVSAPTTTLLAAARVNASPARLPGSMHIPSKPSPVSSNTIPVTPFSTVAALTPVPASKPDKGPTVGPKASQPRTSKQPKQQQEKRLAMTKKKCPNVTRDRLERVTTQRFFMVDRKRADKDGELREEFKVLGSTGNVYTVIIQKVPSCDCPDALKGNHCKHILFIFAKVLQVPFESHVWYQKALLSTELQEVFANAPLAPNDVMNPRIRQAYAQASGSAIPAAGKKRAIEEGTECPVCYEDMFGAQETLLTFCDSCGNALHKECFGEWAKTKGADITCPFCRAKWPAAAVTAAGGRAAGTRGGEGYLNLANAAGLSPVRDTSTYYHGPRRGSRYMGYNRYDEFYDDLY